MSQSNYNLKYLTVTQDGDVWVVRFVLSQLSDDENIEQMGRELVILVEKYGCRKMILSLNDVTYVTSSVLGKMITIHRKLHRHGGRLVICEIPSAIRDILHSSRLLTYFSTASDVQDSMPLFD